MRSLRPRPRGVPLLLATCLAAGALAAPSASADAWQQPAGLVLSPDGRDAYTADYWTLLRLRRDSESGALELVDLHQGGASTLEISPDGRTLYVSAERNPQYPGGLIRIYARDGSSGALSAAGQVESPGGSEFSDLLVSPDGGTLLAAKPGDDAILVYPRDPATGALGSPGRIAGDFSGGGSYGNGQSWRPVGLALSPDGRSLYVGSYGVYVTHFERGGDGGFSFASSIYCNCGAESLVVSPDGERLYAGPQSYAVFERDPQTGTLEYRMRPGSQPTGTFRDQIVQGLAVSADSEAIFGIERRAGFVWADRRTPQSAERIAEYRNGTDGAQGLSAPLGAVLSPDDRHLYVPGPPGGQEDPGTIAVMRHDPATHRLAYASLFRGPRESPFVSRSSGTTALLIDGGAAFTNDLSVVLSVWSNPPAPELLIRNATHGEPPVRRANSADGRYAWTLPATARQGSRLRVEAHPVGPDRSWLPAAAEIVLDRADPRILLARASTRRGRGGRVVLRILARDPVAGVSRVQLGRSPRRPERWRRYRSRLTARASRARYVRVADRASNVSPWRRVTYRRR